jgi:hypothetical protein
MDDIWISLTSNALSFDAEKIARVCADLGVWRGSRRQRAIGSLKATQSRAKIT